MLKRSYGDLNLNREQQESENFVDINVKYRTKTSYEVQIECKGDWNSELMIGINKQLIPKYMDNSKCEYGIYLVFYTGHKNKKINVLEKEIEETIPPKYKLSIKVVCIDITRN